MSVVKGKILKEDVKYWDGVTRSTSRKDSTGGTIAGSKIGNEVDVLATFGNHENYTRSVINDCVNRIGTTSVTLVFAPGTWVIDDDLTIGSNFTCRVPNGCVFSVSSGKTLTFSGPVIRDGQTWTSGSGTVTESGTRYISGKVDLTGAVIQGTNALVFEGTTDNAYETTFAITDPTADRTITFPDDDLDLSNVPTAAGNENITGAWSFAAAVTMSGAPLWEAEGASVASAADCDIWAGGDGNTVHVTGTTTISDWGTAPQAGACMRVIFDGALTLTYNATTNDIEGGVSIKVAAGDSIEVYANTTTTFSVRNISRNSVDEVSVASAATTDIGAVASKNVYITGTTGITSFGTSGAGVRRHVRFADALTITHNATSMICKGGADITTATNDTATVKSLGSGNWIFESFNPVANNPSQASLQGTSTTTLNSASHDFTSIPSWVKKITGIVEGASTNTGTTDTIFIQIGDSGGIETTGYAGAIEDSSGNTAYSTSFELNKTGISPAGTLSCQFVLSLLDSSSNTWGFSCTSYDSTPLVAYGMGTKSLSATLDRVRISRTTGTVFDAGKFRILYE